MTTAAQDEFNELMRDKERRTTHPEDRNSDAQSFLNLSDDDAGAPDGMTVDGEDHLWVAVWGGGQVRRYSPAGELLTVVRVPTENTSSCAFAGPELDHLVISTSTQGLSDEARAAQPDAGRLFVVRPGVTGPAAGVYRGPVDALRQT